MASVENDRHEGVFYDKMMYGISSIMDMITHIGSVFCSKKLKQASDI